MKKNRSISNFNLILQGGYMRKIKIKKKVQCLGWCGKEFYSPDPCRIRFCNSCSARKETAYRGMSKIVNVMDASIKRILSQGD